MAASLENMEQELKRALDYEATMLQNLRTCEMTLSIATRMSEDAKQKVAVASDTLYRASMELVESQPCSYCGRILSSCGGDHGDEMRDEFRRNTRQYK